MTLMAYCMITAVIIYEMLLHRGTWGVSFRVNLLRERETDSDRSLTCGIKRNNARKEHENC